MLPWQKSKPQGYSGAATIQQDTTTENLNNNIINKTTKTHEKIF